MPFQKLRKATECHHLLRYAEFHPKDLIKTKRACKSSTKATELRRRQHIPREDSKPKAARKIG